MIFLAHRGYWKDESKKNSLEALEQAIELGFGMETDLRDYKEELVISHNVANCFSPKVESLFHLLGENQKSGKWIAINIKADGLIELIKEEINKNYIEDYFVFDMSIPQMLEYKQAGMHYFTRQSEYEVNPVLYDNADGVWVDGFESTDWITEELISNHLNQGKKVCIVSPELHKKKDYKVFWKRLRDMKIDQDRVLLCTDYPDEAKEFFYGKEN